LRTNHCRMTLWIVLLGLLLVCASGCEHHFFDVHGNIASDGGELLAWRTSPQGCSRDPADGGSPENTATVATFLWEGPTRKDRPEQHKGRSTPGPLRLEIARSGTGFVGSLTATSHPNGVTLDGSVCKDLTLETHPGPPQFSGGKPTLAGTLVLDCMTHGSHVTANLRFSGCTY